MAIASAAQHCQLPVSSESLQEGIHDDHRALDVAVHAQHQHCPQGIRSRWAAENLIARPIL